MSQLQLAVLLLVVCHIKGFSQLPVASFTVQSNPRDQGRAVASLRYPESLVMHAMAGDDKELDDDDDDDEEELVDEASLGDWRKFRASLISSESSSSASSSKRTKAERVAAQNEALLAQQNQALAQEYRTGVWAHCVGQAEVGGLLCRMPLEAEIYYGTAGGGYWKDKLQVMLSLEQDKITAFDQQNKEDSEATTLAKVEQ